MKLAVLGGGGVRSMFLAKSISGKAKELNIEELALMDNNPEKLRIYGGMAKRVAGILQPQMKVFLTSDASEAVKDADYVITTIRVGGDGMRIRDERIAISKELLGQETTGAAGFSFAMRSIPALIEYCEIIKKFAKPSVKVFNFTNPAGIVSQALRDCGYDFTFGICDAPSGMLNQFAELYGESADNIAGECYGINHLSFFKSITLNGKEILHELINLDDKAKLRTELRFFEKDLLTALDTVPNEYLYYYYYRERAIKNIIEARVTRGELISSVNKNMTNELFSLDAVTDFEKCLKIFEKWHGIRENMYMERETGVKKEKPFEFDIYSPENGGYAGVALRYITLRESGKTGDMVLCVPNNGAIEALNDNDIVEVTCTISGGEAVAHKMRDLPENNVELIRRVKLYERNAAKAIVNKNIRLATDALALHPLVNSYSLAKELVEEYLTLNAEYSAGWR